MKNISFLFPLYNEEKRIENISNFINWIKENKIENYEIILISNGSTDDTKESISEYEKDVRFGGEI